MCVPFLFFIDSREYKRREEKKKRKENGKHKQSLDTYMW